MLVVRKKNIAYSLVQLSHYWQSDIP